jgi:hypothetical protein
MGYFNELSMGERPTPRRLIEPATVAHSQKGGDSAVSTPIEVVTTASCLIRLAHPDDTSLHRALIKAGARLMTHPWAYANGQLEITSHSHPNEIHVATRTGCTCEAFGLCWHIAAVSIISTIAAAGLELVPVLPLPNMILAEDYGDYDPYGSFLDQPIIWSTDDE